MTYFILQKRADGVFGHLHTTKSLAEAKKTKDNYHTMYKIPLASIYIVKMVVY